MSYGTKEQPTKACEGCGEPLPLLRHYKTYLCDDCKENHTRRVGSNAHRLVAAAIRYGFIPPISDCQCVDCGDKATDYDHRDYNKPLEVDPVCRPCNFKRGPAKPFGGVIKLARIAV